MKLHSDPKTGSLYMELTTAVSSETREIADGLNIDFDAAGAVVGIDHASRKLDLTEVAITALPLAPAAA